MELGLRFAETPPHWQHQRHEITQVLMYRREASVADTPLPTSIRPCYEGTWRHRTWRQNVASVAHVVSPSHVATGAATRCQRAGLCLPRRCHLPYFTGHLSSPYLALASKRGVSSPRGVREPCVITDVVFARGIAGHGVTLGRQRNPNWATALLRCHRHTKSLQLLSCCCCFLPSCQPRVMAVAKP